MNEYKVTIEVSAIIKAKNEIEASDIFIKDYNENYLEDYIQLKIGYGDIKRIEKIK
jgi:hypothetical protein